MVTRYGMSEKLGPMALGHQSGQVFLGREMISQPDYSNEIAFQIDTEIRRIVDESCDTAEDLLVRNRRLLEKLSKDLIEYETVDSVHFRRIVDEYAVEGHLSREQSAISLNGHEGKRVIIRRPRKLGWNRHARSPVLLAGHFAPRPTGCSRPGASCSSAHRSEP